MCEVCILAGGLSTRMGRDKARVRLGGRTLLSRVKSTARETGLPVRVIRRDAVPRCGPLGGVITALRSTQAETVLFLSCDMPFVTVGLMRGGLSKLGGHTKAMFTESEGAGFPFALRREALAVCERQFALGKFSLQALARALGARRLRLSKAQRGEVFNVNTPEDFAEARRRLYRTSSAAKVPA